MAAAVIGAVGNEVVAQYRIRVGRRIGSAALEADGIHARTDGVTSLLVLIGAIAVALGTRWADAVVGLMITAAILIVGYQAAKSVGQRLLDAVDPGIVARISTTVAAVDGVVARGPCPLDGTPSTRPSSAQRRRSVTGHKGARDRRSRPP